MSSSEDDEGPTTSPSTSPSTEASVLEVRGHLKCPVCTELFYKPVTLPCGHSFCRHCLLQVANHTVMVATDECKCPSCRQLFALRVSSFHVSIGLWSIIGTLFPQHVNDRKSDAEYIFSSESAKLVSKEHVPQQDVPKPGEYVKDALRNQRCLWRTVHIPEEDVHMRQILALASFPRKVQGETLKIGVAALIMEEDEVTIDEGYPVLVAGDDLAFVDTTQNVRLSFSIFPVDQLSNEKVPPVASADVFSLNENARMKQGKCEVEFDIAGLDPGFWHVVLAGEDSGTPLRLDMTFRIRDVGDEDGDDGDDDDDDDDDDNGKGATYQGSGLVMVSEDDSEDDDSYEDDDQYDEEDGFIVGDDEPIEYSGEEGGDLVDDDDDEDESEDFVIQSSRPAKRRRTTVAISDSDDDE